MPSTDYGKFQNFCRDSGNLRATIPICNLFSESAAHGGSGSGFGQPGHATCDLNGINLSNGRHLANLGSILLCGLGVVIAAGLIFQSNRKKAAVGRREMQLFLLGFIVIEICSIFTIGGFPLSGDVRRAFTAVHVASVVATSWILMMNGAVGYQLVEDGTPMSLGLVLVSAALLFIGTGYIALDTGFSWTGYWDSTLTAPNRAYALYTLYQLVPLLFIVIFFVLEAYLVLRVLGERRPMMWLLAAALLFAIAQVFQYVISVHICNGSDGKINGGMFETLFSLGAVVMVWVFWSSITEDDWPMPGVAASGDEEVDYFHHDDDDDDEDGGVEVANEYAGAGRLRRVWRARRSTSTSRSAERVQSPVDGVRDFMLAAVCCRWMLQAESAATTTVRERTDDASK